MPNMSAETLARIKRAARDPVTGKYMTVPGNMSYQEWYAKYVEGNPQALAREKMARNKSADRQQFQKYHTVLGKDGPKTLEEFQRMKYTEKEQWTFVQLDYSRRKHLLEHPELALPNAAEAVAPEPKFTQYLFNPDSKNGWPKGQAMSSRLGYSGDNWQELQKEILLGARKYPATAKGNNGYGEKYEQSMVLYGNLDTPANVVVGWIVLPDGSVSMTTAYIKEV